MSQSHLNLPSAQIEDLPWHQVNTQAQKIYQQGNDHAFKQEYQQAIEHYSQALELDPNFVVAYCARGQSAIELKQYTEAETDYATALKLSPNLAVAYCGLARVFYSFRDYPGALIACERAIQHATAADRANLDFYHCRALICLKLANYNQVLADCKLILEAEPHQVSARWLNALAHFQLGNYQLAFFNFNQYLNFRSDDPYAYYYRGTCQERLGNLPLALADLTHAINLNRHQSIFYRKRGRIYQVLGNFTGAMTDYDLAISLDPTLAQAYSNRADIYISRGDYSQALIQSNQAIQLNPQLVNAYYQRAVINTESGNLHAALADYHRLIQLNPQDLSAYIQRGWIYFRHGEYPAVMQDCEQILKIDRNSVPANYLLGVVQSLSGFKQEAIFSFNKVLDFHPHFICALYHRGLLRHDLKDIDRAMDDFRAAQSAQNLGLDSISVRDETGLYAEGLALYQMGDPKTARVILQQAAVVAQKLKSTVFHQQIAFTLEALGMN